MPIKDIPDLLAAGALAGTDLAPITQGTDVPVKATLSTMATFVLAQTFPAGSAAAPAVQVGEATTGVYRPAAGELGLSLSGVARVTLNQTLLSISNAGVSSVAVEGESTTTLNIRRHEATNAGGIAQVNHARGTIAAPAALLQNDQFGDFRYAGYTGSGFTSAINLRGTVIAATPSATDMESRWTALLAPAGSATATEALRLEHATGLSMFGANPVIDQNRHHRFRSYTVATLPSASPAGMTIYVSDESGGAVPAFSDGTNWRRYTDRAIVS